MGGVTGGASDVGRAERILASDGVMRRRLHHTPPAPTHTATEKTKAPDPDPVIDDA